MATKTKIVLDADVIIHFIKGGCFLQLFDIFPEYARLIARLGRGESACMVYCRDNYDVLGSSNLKDIKTYCEKNRITYLTTLDFLYYAFIRKRMTAAECNQFMLEVNAKGSRLPIVDITTYVPSCQL